MSSYLSSDSRSVKLFQSFHTSCEFLMILIDQLLECNDEIPSYIYTSSNELLAKVLLLTNSIYSASGRLSNKNDGLSPSNVRSNCSTEYTESTSNKYGELPGAKPSRTPTKSLRNDIHDRECSNSSSVLHSGKEIKYGLVPRQTEFNVKANKGSKESDDITGKALDNLEQVSCGSSAIISGDQRTLSDIHSIEEDSEKSDKFKFVTVGNHAFHIPSSFEALVESLTIQPADDLIYYCASCDLIVISKEKWLGHTREPYHMKISTRGAQRTFKCYWCFLILFGKSELMDVYFRYHCLQLHASKGFIDPVIDNDPLAGYELNSLEVDSRCKESHPTSLYGDNADGSIYSKEGSKAFDWSEDVDQQEEICRESKEDNNENQQISNEEQYGFLYILNQLDASCVNDTVPKKYFYCIMCQVSEESPSSWDHHMYEQEHEAACADYMCIESTCSVCTVTLFGPEEAISEYWSYPVHLDLDFKISNSPLESFHNYENTDREIMSDQGHVKKSETLDESDVRKFNCIYSDNISERTNTPEDPYRMAVSETCSNVSDPSKFTHLNSKNTSKRTDTPKETYQKALSETCSNDADSQGKANTKYVTVGKDSFYITLSFDALIKRLRTQAVNDLNYYCRSCDQNVISEKKWLTHVTELRHIRVSDKHTPSALFKCGKCCLILFGSYSLVYKYFLYHCQQLHPKFEFIKPKIEMIDKAAGKNKSERKRKTDSTLADSQRNISQRNSNSRGSCGEIITEFDKNSCQSGLGHPQRNSDPPEGIDRESINSKSRDSNAALLCGESVHDSNYGKVGSESFDWRQDVEGNDKTSVEDNSGNQQASKVEFLEYFSFLLTLNLNEEPDNYFFCLICQVGVNSASKWKVHKAHYKHLLLCPDICTEITCSVCTVTLLGLEEDISHYMSYPVHLELDSKILGSYNVEVCSRPDKSLIEACKELSESVEQEEFINLMGRMRESSNKKDSIEEWFYCSPCGVGVNDFIIWKSHTWEEKHKLACKNLECVSKTCSSCGITVFGTEDGILKHFFHPQHHKTDLLFTAELLTDAIPANIENSTRKESMRGCFPS